MHKKQASSIVDSCRYSKMHAEAGTLPPWIFTGKGCVNKVPFAQYIHLIFDKIRSRNEVVILAVPHNGKGNGSGNISSVDQILKIDVQRIIDVSISHPIGSLF